MRSGLLVVLLIVMCIFLTSCVQPRVGSPGYSNPYGDTSYSPERRWWGEESPRADVDIDKFMWRWRGLNE